MTPFRFILLTLIAFRFTRLLTTDLWPPTKRFRELVEDRFGEESGWYVLITCPWCAGAYITAAVFVVDWWLNLPVYLLAGVAATSLVGYLGTYDSRD